MMSGFVIRHAIGHQRRFAKYRARLRRVAQPHHAPTCGAAITGPSAEATAQGPVTARAALSASPKIVL
jgi:hypothetical protein